MPETLKYYKLSADQNNAEGQYRYALCLEYGKSIEKNTPETLKYYKLSADQGNSKGQYHYALCLEWGKYIHKDLLEAERYHKLSAEQYYPDARFNYARLLYRRKRTYDEECTMVKYFLNASNAGISDASRFVGECLRNGYGRLVRNYDLARHFGDIAKNQAKEQELIGEERESLSEE